MDRLTQIATISLYRRGHHERGVMQWGVTVDLAR
ncbi:hypothetical protein FHX47_002001 [Garicola koreensis]|uniref:Uncharacterized protein n=1 Tax=Garicola koreensis TaxID=1262554 RepID=A0A7W5TR92_9MICC|nr:hypothetical protein [Garicola koreensis]